MPEAIPGRICIVLHTHLPWVAHFGSWPVGEEWFHQAFTASWMPVVDVLREHAESGRPGSLTLGLTPIAMAAMDDPYLLRESARWSADWQLRAGEAVRRGGVLAEAARDEWQRARHTTARLDQRWAHGASPILEALARSGTVELLAGPSAHQFLPLYDSDVRRHFLRTGLADQTLRTMPASGIWLPECGYAPGLETDLAAEGVSHLVLDAAAQPNSLPLAQPLGDSDVLAFFRDLTLTDRVWSARDGYPGDPRYRDFHTYEHSSGLRLRAVTADDTHGEAKSPWNPRAAAHAVEQHAHDFLVHAGRRLTDLAQTHGRPCASVVAWDTELFGHWWLEGPLWLAAVLRLAPEYGIELSTLASAIDSGYIGDRAHIGSTSWGAGKDFHLWDGAEVADLRADQRAASRLAVQLAERGSRVARSAALDQAARELHLMCSSDWAFMRSRDSAADYALRRHRDHHDALTSIADLVDRHGLESRQVREFARGRRALAGPFGHIDIRTLRG